MVGDRMNWDKATRKILKAAAAAIRLSVRRGEMLVWLSDGHLGNWDGADDARDNGGVTEKAVDWYIGQLAKFIIGGDFYELMEVRRPETIYAHPRWRRITLKILANLALYILGNHDPPRKMVPFLKKFDINEELIVEAAWIGAEILLFHGFQYDFFNKGGWVTRVVGWIIRHIWAHIQREIGSKLSPRTNPKLSGGIKSAETRLAKHLNRRVLTGHRHTPEIELLGAGAVFIDGGCGTGAEGVYCVEITYDTICPVLWDRDTGERRVIKTYYRRVGEDMIHGDIQVNP